jgi:lysophospholipase
MNESAEPQWLLTGDGVRLRWAHFSVRSPRAHVVLLTGRNEFIEKYEEVIGELRERRYAVWTLDWRGQGLSTRALPQRQRGHVESFTLYLNDLRRFMLRHVLPGARGAHVTFLAHSLGGHVALRYMHDFPGEVRFAALSAPLLDLQTRHYPPPFVRLISSAAALTRFAREYAPGMHDYDERREVFEGNDLTSDRARFTRRIKLLADRPELSLGGVTLGWLAAAYRSIDLVSPAAYLRAITTPILLFVAGNDRVVVRDALERAATVLPSCRLVRLAHAQHEILQETDEVRAAFWSAFDQFARERL